MKYFLVLFIFGILSQNTFARGLDNPGLDDFEERLVRLETRQFSESENLEHRMLLLETHLGNQTGKEPLQIPKEENLAEGLTFLQRLEKVEKNWEKELDEKLAKLSSKYESLSERFSAIEGHLEEHTTTKTTLPENAESVNGHNFQKIGTKYYFIQNNEKEEMLVAMDKCQNMSAHLVSLQNEEEWNALKEALNPDNSYWTDISDMHYSNYFVSYRGFSAFLKWDEGEPNRGGKESCVELKASRGHKMNDVDCSDLKNYICEYTVKKKTPKFV